MIASQNDCQIQLITSDREFGQCRDAWNDLAVRHVFERWEWMYQWWATFGTGSRLAMVVVREANGRWLGIAPWYKTESVSRGTIVRQLATGSACSDYNSLLIRPGYESVVARTLAGIMDGGTCGEWFSDVNLFELEGHLIDDPGMIALHEALSAADVRIGCDEFAATWRCKLPGQWDEFESRLHKSFRRKTKKANTRLAAPEFSMQVLSSRQALLEHWDMFVQLHQLRRESLGQPGCFADPKFNRFLVQACSALAEVSRAQINVIHYLGHPLAANLEFVSGDTVSMYQSGFDPQFLNLEPGHLIFTSSIRSAMERGFVNFDFLRGDEPYKARWKATRVPLYRTRVIPNRLSARLRNVVCIAGQQLKNWTRSIAAATTTTGF